MNEIIEMVIPKETVSDESYKLMEIYFVNGAKVKKGDIIVTFETSKSTIDAESSCDGYVFYNCQLYENLPIGFLYAVISPNSQLPDKYFETRTEQPEETKLNLPKNSEIRFSKPALKLIEEHKLDISVFSGKKIIEKKDVDEYLLQKNGIVKRASKNIANSIIIVGGGNHTKMCIDILRQTNVFHIAGIVFTKFSPGDDVMGIPVLGDYTKLHEIFDHEAKLAVVGIGGLEKPIEREDLYNKLKSIGFYCPNIIHPKSIIEPSAVLGEGNQIMAGAIIGSCSTICNNSIINSNSVVSHDCFIGDNVHITPGAILAGTVDVGNNTIVGMGATIYYKCKIGRNVIIANGQHIFKDIQDNSILK